MKRFIVQDRTNNIHNIQEFDTYLEANKFCGKLPRALFIDLQTKAEHYCEYNGIVGVNQLPKGWTR